MLNEKTKYSLACLILFLLIPIHASANMIWPSLYIMEGMVTWYVILIGLITEIVFVKCFLKHTFLKSVLIAFVMNVASTVLGIVVIPLSGIIVEVLMIPFGTGTFHPSHVIMSFIFAVLSNVLIEGLTVKWIFKYKFKKMFWWLFIANAISVAAACLVLGFKY